MFTSCGLSDCCFLVRGRRFANTKRNLEKHRRYQGHGARTYKCDETLPHIQQYLYPRVSRSRSHQSFTSKSNPSTKPQDTRAKLTRRKSSGTSVITHFFLSHQCHQAHPPPSAPSGTPSSFPSPLSLCQNPASRSLSAFSLQSLE
jgi:hypothetical protein